MGWYPCTSKLGIRKLNLTGSIEENKYAEEEQKPRKWYFHPMIGRVWYTVIYFCEYPKNAVPSTSVLMKQAQQDQRLLQYSAAGPQLLENSL